VWPCKKIAAGFFKKGSSVGEYKCGDNIIKLEEQNIPQPQLCSTSSTIAGLQLIWAARWIQLLALSLALNYYFPFMLISS
jgi:hypothetical protein